MFRELQEGLLEAEMRRVDRGTWPAVSSLAADGIPPFALDPTAKGGPYDWRLATSGALVNYLGAAAATRTPRPGSCWSRNRNRARRPIQPARMKSTIA